MMGRQKRQKSVVNLSAKNNVFTFIPNNAIVDIDTLNKGFVPSTKFNLLKQKAVGHWSGNAKNKIIFTPFDDLQVKLDQSPSQLISQTHNRLLIEEMMLLPPSASFVCALLNDHYFLKQILLQTKIKKILEENPTKPFIINRKVYYRPVCHPC